MAGRIRSIKPEWLEDAPLGSRDDAARVLSVALILMADDYGNGRAHPAHVAAMAWTYDPNSRASFEKAKAALLELARIKFVVLYAIDGQDYFHVRNWAKHQKVERPGKPRVAGPETPGAIVFSLPSRDPRETLATDLRPPTSDHDHDHEETAAAAASEPPGSGSSVPRQVDLPRPSLEQPAPRPEPSAPANIEPPRLLLVPTEPAKPSPAETVFAAYLAEWKRCSKSHRPPTLTESRRKLANARLREFSVEDLAHACRGIWASRWHVNAKETSFELAIRDAAHIEKFMAIADEPNVKINHRGDPKQSGRTAAENGVPEDIDVQAS